MRILFLILLITLIAGCDTTEHKQVDDRDNDDKAERITLTLAEANRLATLPIHCIQQPLPYKSGVVIAKEEDLAMPQVCLLYTSPSPRDRTRSRMPSSA